MRRKRGRPLGSRNLREQASEKAVAGLHFNPFMPPGGIFKNSAYVRWFFYGRDVKVTMVGLVEGMRWGVGGVDEMGVGEWMRWGWGGDEEESEEEVPPPPPKLASSQCVGSPLISFEEGKEYYEFGTLRKNGHWISTVYAFQVASFIHIKGINFHRLRL